MASTSMEHSERRGRSLEETVVRDMMPDSEHAHLSSDGNALLAAVRAELKAFKKEMKEVIKQEVKIQRCASRRPKMSERPRHTLTRALNRRVWRSSVRMQCQPWKQRPGSQP